MNEELKEILIENINNFDVINHMDYYLKTYQQPMSNFNNADFFDLQIYLMQQFHKSKNLSSLFEDSYSIDILKSIPVDFSKEEFVKRIIELTNYRGNSVINFAQRLFNVFNNKIIDLGGWFKIYSQNVTGELNKDITHRIYVAVDNSCLHRFSLLLIKQCQVYDVPYCFKINNGDGGNQYDNVVIYTREEDLAKYIDSISEILNKNPDIKLNKACIIGHKYDENIVVAPYIDTVSESYSSIISNMIRYYRDTSEDRVEFLTNVENILDRTLVSTKELCEKIKSNKIERKSTGF